MEKTALKYIMLSLVCMALCGCADNSYRGYFDEEDYGENAMPIAVRIMIGSSDDITDIGLSSNSRPAAPATKGSGVVADASQLVGHDFYVYAFNTDMNTNMAVTSAEDDSRCLIDGSIDNPATKAGKRAKISDISNVVEWQDDEGQIFWPDGDRSRQIYSLFAYYVDDISVSESDIRRTDDYVSIDVEIDGSQDLMSSRAEMTNEQKSVFKDDKELAAMMQYCYSYYAAQNGINPVFVFKHHLTRLDFTVTPGYSPNIVNEMTIQEISVSSKYKASFTVADKDDPSNVGLVFSDERAFLELTEDGAEPLQQDYYKVTTLLSPDESLEGRTTKVGGSLLVAPDVEYTARMVFSEKSGDGIEFKDVEVLLPVVKGTEFEAGNRYSINFTIYGSTRVFVDVQLVDWLTGEDVLVDDEDSWIDKNVI